MRRTKVGGAVFHFCAWRGGPKFWTDTKHYPNAPAFHAAYAEAIKLPKPSAYMTPAMVDDFLFDAGLMARPGRQKQKVGERMNNRIKYLALAGSVALLAGCGGGGGGGATADYTAIETAARDLADGYIDPDTGALEAAARTSLPAAGTATYNGFVKGEVDGDGLIGELELTVEFALSDNGTITGSADNFQHETDGAYTGTLDVTAGNILPGVPPADGNAIAVDLTGTLANAGVLYDTEIHLDGSFMGGVGAETPDAIGGAAVRTVGGSFLDGVFIVTQP